MLLVTASFPRAKALKNAGAQGRRQINQYTRYLAIALAAFQANNIAFGLENIPGVVIEPGWFFHVSTITTLVAGTVILIWLADQITKRRIGNGIVVLLIAGPVLGLLSAFARGIANNW
jgi:preprotein translocase subunit SecY